LYIIAIDNDCGKSPHFLNIEVLPMLLEKKISMKDKNQPLKRYKNKQREKSQIKTSIFDL
jgi:hypothetical protein